MLTTPIVHQSHPGREAFGAGTLARQPEQVERPGLRRNPRSLDLAGIRSFIAAAWARTRP